MSAFSQVHAVYASDVVVSNKDAFDVYSVWRKEYARFRAYSKAGEKRQFCSAVPGCPRPAVPSFLKIDGLEGGNFHGDDSGDHPLGGW